MGSFAREGTFRDRGRFIEGLRGKLAELQKGAFSGLTETWEPGAGGDIVRLAGFGARIEFVIGPAAWKCAAEIPGWIPIPLSAIEEKFDREFKGLSEL